MHTVIITNEQSMSLLKNYRFLFTPFVKNGQIDFCGWNEAGTDILSALPDLGRIIRGKHEWKAVVVLDSTINDDGTGKKLFDESNPYDFLCNADKGNEVSDTEVPLVRLTYMLGGLPTLGVKDFLKAYTYYDEEKEKSITVRDCDITEEEKSALFGKYGTDLRVTFDEDKYTEEERAAYAEIEEKYSFAEDRPQEVILISTRKTISQDVKVQVLRSWQNSLEAQSSDFWKRNNYPNVCRFLFSELPNPASSVYAKELFRFWISVLTIAINSLPPSCVQAYKLYRLNAIIDQEKLDKILNTHISRLFAARTSVKDRMRKKPEYTFSPNTNPAHRQRIPVYFENVEESSVYIDFTPVGIARDIPNEEVYFWQKSVVDADNALTLVLKAPRRAIDIAATYTRDKAESFIGDEYEIDRFQFQDLKEDADALSDKVFLPDTKNLTDMAAFREMLSETDKKIKKDISIRPTKRAITGISITALSIFILGFVPYFINSAKVGFLEFICSFILSLGATALVAMGGLIALSLLKKRHLRLLQGYNDILRRIISSLNSASVKFSEYLSDVCTYMHIQSILDGIKLKERSHSSLRHMLRSHNIALNEAIEREQGWCGSFGVELNIAPVINISDYFSVGIPPISNEMYLWPVEDELKCIPLNDTGESVYAPYDFLSEFFVDREELYDNTIDGGN